jgi:low affinity iron permease
VQLKLNEIVAAIEGASNRLISVEDLSEKDLAVIHAHYRKLADMAKSDLSILQSHSIDEAEARHERKRRAHQPNTYRNLYVALNVGKFLRDLALSSLPYAFSASASHAAFNDGLVRRARSTSASASWEVSNKACSCLGC